MEAAIATNTDQKQEIHRIFELQKANHYSVGKTTAADRVKKLDKLFDAVVSRKDKIRQVLFDDFRKAPEEVDLTEIYILTSDIKHVRKHLHQWMAPKRVGTPLSMMGSSSWYQYESKGVCLVIAPWNFPFQLTFGPLISAIAAGNCCMIKPSENTPHTSALMREIVEEVFDEGEVALFEGGVETSTALLELPFNHIFFTGAPNIGKIVMKAAAKNLTSVTLELGGKSPTIVDETANIKTAANRIAWGKFTNNGQICIAPDYLYVHESKKDELVNEIKARIKAFYGEDVKASVDYNRIVNNRHFGRIKNMLDDAVSKGANVIMGGDSDGTQNYIAPTILEDAPMDSLVMTEEIFGPVLPIKTFKNLDEVIDVIQSKEKPLALYIYSSSRKNIKKITENTRAGGTCINNNDVHFFNPNLPFGGSNNSGIGKSHGKFGFEAFSDARGFYKQHLPGALEMLMPPYTGFKRKLIDFTIKWF